jgi:hypothetical protein
MAETLVANGDGDDYFERGASAAESHANGFNPLNVSPGLHHEALPPSSGTFRVASFAGYITTRRETPPMYN